MNQRDVDGKQGNLWEMSYEEVDECKHTLPGDWEFGGADGVDPRSDQRWRPTTYLYLDRNLRPRHFTCVPQCDHEAMGSYRDLVDSRVLPDLKCYYILALYPGAETQVTIYADPEGALDAASFG